MGGLQASWKVDCARADVAVRCSGEALSLPKPFWGGSQPPRALLGRLMIRRPEAGVGWGRRDDISVALYVCY